MSTYFKIEHSPSQETVSISLLKDEGEKIVSVKDVKTYGKSWKGFFLYLFRVASKTTTGEYINKQDFFNKLVEEAIKLNPKIEPLKGKNVEIIKHLNRDKKTDRNHLNAKNITEIYSKILNREYLDFEKFR